MHAVRNIQLCTKDCLCLYVCPTGATDTETGQIDAEKCISGCRACVDACPSHAISLVPEVFPVQQKKTQAVKDSLGALSLSKVQQAQIAAGIAKASDDRDVRQLAKAIEMSNRLMAEDLIREAGFMLPQSQNTIDFLKSLLATPQHEDFPKDAVEKLLELLSEHL
jgi:Fe-S-cluster-containing hydrogenase component 2